MASAESVEEAIVSPPDFECSPPIWLSKVIMSVSICYLLDSLYSVSSMITFLKHFGIGNTIFSHGMSFFSQRTRDRIQLPTISIILKRYENLCGSKLVHFISWQNHKWCLLAYMFICESVGMAYDFIQVTF